MAAATCHLNFLPLSAPPFSTHRNNLRSIPLWHPRNESRLALAIWLIEELTVPAGIGSEGSRPGIVSLVEIGAFRSWGELGAVAPKVGAGTHVETAGDTGLASAFVGFGGGES